MELRKGTCFLCSNTRIVSNIDIFKALKSIFHNGSINIQKLKFTSRPPEVCPTCYHKIWQLKNMSKNINVSTFNLDKSCILCHKNESVVHITSKWLMFDQIGSDFSLSSGSKPFICTSCIFFLDQRNQIKQEIFSLYPEVKVDSSPQKNKLKKSGEGNLNNLIHPEGVMDDPKFFKKSVVIINLTNLNDQLKKNNNRKSMDEPKKKFTLRHKSFFKIKLTPKNHSIKKKLKKVTRNYSDYLNKKLVIKLEPISIPILNPKEDEDIENNPVPTEDEITKNSLNKISNDNETEIGIEDKLVNSIEILEDDVENKNDDTIKDLEGTDNTNQNKEVSSPEIIDISSPDNVENPLPENIQTENGTELNSTESVEDSPAVIFNLVESDTDSEDNSVKEVKEKKDEDTEKIVSSSNDSVPENTGHEKKNLEENSEGSTVSPADCESSTDSVAVNEEDRANASREEVFGEIERRLVVYFEGSSKERSKSVEKDENTTSKKRKLYDSDLYF